MGPFEKNSLYLVQKLRFLLKSILRSKVPLFHTNALAAVISYISLLRGVGKKKAQVHRPPSDVFPSPCILCLLRLEDPSIVPLSPD